MDNTLPSKHVVIIGGGITGLSTAYYLQKEAESNNITYTLLEKSDRWGGKIYTDEVDDFVVEGGPDSFITQKPWALQLARELGMEERLLPTNDHLRQTFVLNKGKPTPLPDGVFLMIPTKFTPFALSPLISPLGKLRMGMDLFIKPKLDGKDETLAEFIQRRLGAEALDKIAEPLMSGIYNAEAERQSLLATFPRFRAIEEKHGSLIKGMLAAQRAAQAAKAKASTNGSGSKKSPSVFISFQSGMNEFVDELVDRLDGDLRLATAVTNLSKQDQQYQLTLDDGSKMMADAVVLAIPAYTAADLIQSFAPDAADGLNNIRYVSTGTISLAFKRDGFEHPLNGFGIVIPRSENRSINAITWSSTKFNQRAPEDHVLLRVFFGGSRHPEMMDVDDETLYNTVRQELRDIMNVSATPLFHRIYRWRRANPQYDVGHQKRVADIVANLPNGLYVTGSPYGGIGIPDCVRQAKATAVALQAAFKTETTTQIEEIVSP